MQTRLLYINSLRSFIPRTVTAPIAVAASGHGAPMAARIRGRIDALGPVGVTMGARRAPVPRRLRRRRRKTLWRLHRVMGGPCALRVLAGRRQVLVMVVLEGLGLLLVS